MNTKTEINLTEIEIYQEYRTKIIPFIVTLEVLDNEFPVEILNEIRSIFTHLAAYNLDNSQNDLQLASRHLTRAILDCHKFICISIEDQISTFRNDYRKVNLSIADNGNFLPQLNRLHSIARKKMSEAKHFESISKNDSENRENSIAVYETYEAAYLAYDKLHSFLLDSNEAIAFASSQSKYVDLINKVSLAFGFIGIILTIWGFF